MTEQEIRDGAPSGATHYINMHDITYHKRESNIWYFWDNVFKTWEYMHPTWVSGLKLLP